MAHFGPLLRKSGRATGQADLPIPTPLHGDITIRAALITMIGISLAFPFCCSSIMFDTSASSQSFRNIDDSLDLDMYDSNDGNEVMGTSL